MQTHSFYHADVEVPFRRFKNFRSFSALPRWWSFSTFLPQTFIPPAQIIACFCSPRILTCATPPILYVRVCISAQTPAHVTFFLHENKPCATSAVRGIAVCHMYLLGAVLVCSCSTVPPSTWRYMYDYRTAAVSDCCTLSA